MASTLAAGTTVSNLVEVPIEPDVLDWGLQDISSSDAGRVLDGNNTMYKNRTSQKRKLRLSWNNPSLKDASAILAMFNPEYVYVRYPDVLDGALSVRQFYMGDRSAPFRQVTLPLGDGGSTVITTLSFDIIER